MGSLFSPRWDVREVWRILTARKLGLSDDQRQRTAACQDTQQLKRWIERALSARSAAEVFSD